MEGNVLITWMATDGRQCDNVTCMAIDGEQLLCCN